MADTNFLAGQSSLWVQPSGPNTEPRYLGCHGVGDLTEPFGDETLLYCPDPAQVGAYTVKNSYTGEPGAITTSIETDLRKTADYLEQISKCAVPIYIHKVSCGRRDVFTNFDRSFILRQAKVTSRALGNLASRSPGNENESTQTFEVTARYLTRVFNLDPARMTIVTTTDVTGIAICGEDRCAGDCGPGESLADAIFAVTKAAASTADVLESIDGASFAATGADPFAATYDIQGVVCFKIGRDSTRILVGRGTTIVASPAAIAYSDDGGDTWTTVSVGSTNGEFIPNTHSIFALDRYHIWVGTDLGKIYFSSDAGLTWTLQESGAISATDIMGISFIDGLRGFAVYTGGEVAACVDGESWSAVTTSGATVATDIHAISAYDVWVSGSNGMWYSTDGGTTWHNRISTAIAAFDFLDELFGIAVGSAASSGIYMTINGGYDWQILPTVANSGFLDVTIANPQLAFVSGKANGGTGFIAKLLPQA